MTDPKNEEKHAGGRPLKFTDVKELEKRIEAYFKPTFRQSDQGISGELPGSHRDSRQTVGRHVDPQQSQHLLGSVRQFVVEAA
jgi:hypothetical protein